MAEGREESRQRQDSGKTAARQWTDRRAILPSIMDLKGELRQELESLEAEYRYWLIETIRMDRSIDTIAADIQQHSQELGSERVADFQRRLDDTRSQHEEIDYKIQGIRLRLDTLRERLAGML